MRDKIEAIGSALVFFGGLALAGSENDFMPWLNLLGVFLIAGAAMAMNNLYARG